MKRPAVFEKTIHSRAIYLRTVENSRRTTSFRTNKAEMKMVLTAEPSKSVNTNLNNGHDVNEQKKENHVTLKNTFKDPNASCTIFSSHREEAFR
eukprot:scaffold121003_cov34-Attheya_sp.AAC.2